MHWIIEIVAPGLSPLTDRVAVAINLPSRPVETPAPPAFRPEEIAEWVDSAMLESVR
jgi:hypothetical protein